MQDPKRRVLITFKHILVSPDKVGEASNFMQWVILDECKEVAPFPFPIYGPGGIQEISVHSLVADYGKGPDTRCLIKIEPVTNVHMEAPQGKKRYVMHVTRVTFE